MNDRINSTTLVAVPYPDMVKNLFKEMGSQSATLLHAAAGIAGEATELALSTSISEMAMELGDIEFYIEAAYQTLGGRVLDSSADLAVYSEEPCANQVVSTIPIAIMTTAGTLLDAAKKCWAYDNPITLDIERDMRLCLMRLEVMLMQFYQLIGMQRTDVLRTNQIKLGKRYPGGVYSDRAALTRADT